MPNINFNKKQLKVWNTDNQTKNQEKIESFIKNGKHSDSFRIDFLAFLEEGLRKINNKEELNKTFCYQLFEAAGVPEKEVKAALLGNITDAAVNTLIRQILTFPVKFGYGLGKMMEISNPWTKTGKIVTNQAIREAARTTKKSFGFWGRTKPNNYENILFSEEQMAEFEKEIKNLIEKFNGVALNEKYAKSDSDSQQLQNKIGELKKELERIQTTEEIFRGKIQQQQYTLITSTITGVVLDIVVKTLSAAALATANLALLTAAISLVTRPMISAAIRAINDYCYDVPGTARLAIEKYRHAKEQITREQKSQDNQSVQENQENSKSTISKLMPQVEKIKLEIRNHYQPTKIARFERMNENVFQVQLRELEKQIRALTFKQEKYQALSQVTSEQEVELIEKKYEKKRKVNHIQGMLSKKFFEINQHKILKWHQEFKDQKMTNHEMVKIIDQNFQVFFSTIALLEYSEHLKIEYQETLDQIEKKQQELKKNQQDQNLDDLNLNVEHKRETTSEQETEEIARTEDINILNKEIQFLNSKKETRNQLLKALEELKQFYQKKKFKNLYEELEKKVSEELKRPMRLDRYGRDLENIFEHTEALKKLNEEIGEIDSQLKALKNNANLEEKYKNGIIYFNKLSEIKNELETKKYLYDKFKKEVRSYLLHRHWEIEATDSDSLVVRAIQNNDQGRVKYVKKKFKDLGDYIVKNHVTKKSNDPTPHQLKNPIHLVPTSITAGDVAINTGIITAVQKTNVIEKKEEEKNILELIELIKNFENPSNTLNSKSQSLYQEVEEQNLENSVLSEKTFKPQEMDQEEEDFDPVIFSTTNLNYSIENLEEKTEEEIKVLFQSFLYTLANDQDPETTHFKTDYSLKSNTNESPSFYDWMRHEDTWKSLFASAVFEEISEDILRLFIRKISAHSLCSLSNFTKEEMIDLLKDQQKAKITLKNKTLSPADIEILKKNIQKYQPKLERWAKKAKKLVSGTTKYVGGFGASIAYSMLLGVCNTVLESGVFDGVVDPIRHAKQKEIYENFIKQANQKILNYTTKFLTEKGYLQNNLQEKIDAFTKDIVARKIDKTVLTELKENNIKIAFNELAQQSIIDEQKFGKDMDWRYRLFAARALIEQLSYLIPYPFLMSGSGVGKIAALTTGQMALNLAASDRWVNMDARSKQHENAFSWKDFMPFLGLQQDYKRLEEIEKQGIPTLFSDPNLVDQLGNLQNQKIEKSLFDQEIRDFFKKEGIVSLKKIPDVVDKNTTINLYNIFLKNTEKINDLQGSYTLGTLMTLAQEEQLKVLRDEDENYQELVKKIKDLSHKNSLLTEQLFLTMHAFPQIKNEMPEEFQTFAVFTEEQIKTAERIVEIEEQPLNDHKRLGLMNERNNDPNRLYVKYYAKRTQNIADYQKNKEELAQAEKALQEKNRILVENYERTKNTKNLKLPADFEQTTYINSATQKMLQYESLKKNIHTYIKDSQKLIQEVDTKNIQKQIDTFTKLTQNFLKTVENHAWFKAASYPNDMQKILEEQQARDIIQIINTGYVFLLGKVSENLEIKTDISKMHFNFHQSFTVTELEKIAELKVEDTPVYQKQKTKTAQEHQQALTQQQKKPIAEKQHRIINPKTEITTEITYEYKGKTYTSWLGVKNVILAEGSNKDRFNKAFYRQAEQVKISVKTTYLTKTIVTKNTKPDRIGLNTTTTPDPSGDVKTENFYQTLWCPFRAKYVEECEPSFLNTLLNKGLLPENTEVRTTQELKYSESLRDKINYFKTKNPELVTQIDQILEKGFSANNKKFFADFFKTTRENQDLDKIEEIEQFHQLLWALFRQLYLTQPKSAEILMDLAGLPIYDENKKINSSAVDFFAGKKNSAPLSSKKLQNADGSLVLNYPNFHTLEQWANTLLPSYLFEAKKTIYLKNFKEKLVQAAKNNDQTVLKNFFDLYSEDPSSSTREELSVIHRDVLAVLWEDFANNKESILRWIEPPLNKAKVNIKNEQGNYNWDKIKLILWLNNYRNSDIKTGNLLDSASETLAAETFEKLLKAHQAKTEDVQKSKLEQTELLKVPAQVVLVDPSYLTSEKKIEGLEPILELWNLEEHIRFHTDQLLKNNSWTNFTPTFSEQSLRNTVEAFSKSLKQYTLKLQNSWEAGKVEPEKIQQVTKIWQEKTDRLITWLSNETGNHVKNTTKINQTVLEELRNSCILSSDPETTFNNACQKSFAKYTVSLSIPITLQAETDNLKFEIARKKINAVDETIQNLQPILVENLKALDLYDTLFSKEEQALSPEKFALLVSSRKQMILDHLTTIRETPEVKNVTSYADKRKIEEDPNKFIKKQKITNAINDFESMFFQQIVPEPVFIPERLIQRVPVNIGDCLMTIQLQENNFNFKYQGTHADDAQLIAFLNKHKNDFLGVKLYQTKAPLLTKEKVWEKIITFVDQFITILETEDTEKRNQIIEGIREDQFKDGLSAIFSEAQLSSTQREYKNLATSAGKELLKQYFSNTINTVTNNGSFFTDLYIKMLLLQTEKSINFFDDNTNSANFGATLRQDLQKIKKLQSLLSADKISRGSSYPTISDLHQATKERLDPINVYKRNLNSDLELNTSDNLYNAVALLENFTPVHHKNMESLNILLTNFPQKNQLTELEKKTLLRILSGQDHLNYAETRGSLLKDAVQYLKETIDKYQIILTKELEQAVTLKNSAVTSSLRIQLFYIAQIDKRLSKQVSNVPNLNNNRNKDIEPLLRNREQINSFFEGLTKSFIEVNTIEVNPSNLYSTECFVDLRRNLPLNSTIKNIYAKDLNKKADEFQRLANHLDRNMKYQSQQIKQKIDNLEIRFPYFNPTLDPNGKQNPRSESLFKRFKIVYMDHTFNLRRSKKYHDDKDVIHLAVLLDYYFAQHYNEDNNRAHEIDESEDYKIDYKKDYYNSYHRRGKLLVTYIRNTLSKIHGFNFSTAYRENVMQTYLNSLAPRQMEHADINAVYASKEFQNLSNILYTNILIWSEFMENSKIYEKYLVKSPHEHLNRYAQSAVVDLRPDRLLMLVNSDEAETTSQSALDKRVSSYVRTNYNSKILDYLFNEDITRTPVFPDLLKTEEAKNTIKGFYLDLEDLKLATIGDNEIQRKINYYNAPNNANKKRILIEYEKLIKTSSAINNCFTSLTEFNALYTRIENHPTLNINTLNAIFQEYVTNVVMPRLRERGYNDPDITTDRIIVLLLWTRSFIPAMSKQIQEFAFNNPDFIQPVKSFFTNPVENLPRYQPDTKIEIIKPARVDLDLEELSNIKRYGLEVPLILPEINKIYSGNSRNITIQIQSEEQGIEEKHIKELYGYVFPEANGKDQQIFYITATKHLDTRVSSSSPENSLLDKIANIAKQLKNGDTLNLLLPLHGGKGEGFITSMPVVNLSDFMIAADDNSIPKKLSPTQKVYTIPKIIDTIVTNLKPGVQLKTLCISHAGCYGAADANRINGRYVTNSNSFLSRIVAALKHKGYTQIENIFVFAHTNESVHIQQTDNPIDTYIPRSATVENDSLPMGYYVNIKTNKDGFFLIEKETNAQNRINIHERLENQSRRTIQNFTQPANDLDADGNGPTCSSNVRNYSEINNGFENLNQTRHKILAVPKSPNNLNIDTKIYNPINVSEDAIDYAMDAIKEGYENYFSNQAILNKKSTDQIIPKAPLNETKNQTQSCAAETLKRVQAKYLKRY